MLEWLIATLADLLGISPLSVIGLLVVVSVGGSAALRWYRSVRKAENYYLDLAQHVIVSPSPPAVQPGPEDRGLLQRLR
jgi:hypothetical protein